MYLNHNCVENTILMVIYIPTICPVTLPSTDNGPKGLVTPKYSWPIERSAAAGLEAIMGREAPHIASGQQKARSSPKRQVIHLGT